MLEKNVLILIRGLSLLKYITEKTNFQTFIPGGVRNLEPTLSQCGEVCHVQ